MGRFENIQWGLEKGIEAFGQTFTPLYTKGIEMANRITLQNYLMQKRLEAQTEAYKQRRLWELNQKIKTETAKINAMNLADLQSAFEGIDKMKETAIRSAIKPYLKQLQDNNIDVGILSENPDVVINDILKSDKIANELKMKIKDIYQKSLEMKRALVKNQRDRIKMKLDSVTDVSEKAGYLDAYNNFENIYSNIQEQINKLSVSKDEDILTELQKKPRSYLEAIQTKRKIELTDLSKQMQDFKLQLIKEQYSPDAIYDKVKNFADTLSVNIGKAFGQYKKQAEAIMNDKSASDIEKNIKLRGLLDVMDLDFKIWTINQRLKQKQALTQSDINTLATLGVDLNYYEEKYKNNPNIKIYARKIKSIVSKKDLTKKDMIEVRKYLDALKTEAKKIDELVGKAVKSVKGYLQIVKSYSKDDIVSTALGDDAVILENYLDGIANMLESGVIDTSVIENFNSIVDSIKNKVNKEKVLKNRVSVRRFINALDKLKIQVRQAFSTVAIGKYANVKIKQRQTGYEGVTREELEDTYSELDKQQPNELISEKEEEEEYYLNLEDYLSPEITIYP